MTTGKQNGKYQVKIVPTAQKDLRDAALYIAQDSPVNARKFVADIRARLNNVLANSPNICLPPRAYPFLWILTVFRAHKLFRFMGLERAGYRDTSYFTQQEKLDADYGRP